MDLFFINIRSVVKASNGHLLTAKVSNVSKPERHFRLVESINVGAAYVLSVLIAVRYAACVDWTT